MIGPERKAQVRQGYPHFVIEDSCKIDSIEGLRSPPRLRPSSNPRKNLPRTWQSTMPLRRSTLRDEAPFSANTLRNHLWSTSVQIWYGQALLDHYLAFWSGMAGTSTSTQRVEESGVVRVACWTWSATTMKWCIVPWKWSNGELWVWGWLWPIQRSIPGLIHSILPVGQRWFAWKSRDDETSLHIRR